MWFTAKAILKSVILPPGVFILALAIALAVWRIRPGLAKWLVGLSCVGMAILSVPAVTGAMYAALLVHPPLPPSGPLPEAQAIVVLGGGTLLNQPEFGADRPSAGSAGRAHYAVALAKRTGVPILVTGGNPRGGALSEADVIAQMIEKELGHPVRWRERASNDTWRNAVLTADVLRSETITEIYLVTDATHMRRAVRAFEAQGFGVVPAPTRFLIEPGVRLSNLLPAAYSLGRAGVVANEVLGELTYRLRGLFE